MMVGGEDRDQLELFAREILDHRARVARIDHRRALVVAQRPDIVVFECFYGNDL
jgi:hypothetical protein